MPTMATLLKTLLTRTTLRTCRCRSASMSHVPRRCFSSDFAGHDDDQLLLNDVDHDNLMQAFFSVPGAGQRLFLIQPQIKSGPHRHHGRLSVQLQLQEAVSLAETIHNWKVVAKIVVPTNNIATKLLFGSGNVEKLKQLICDKANISAVFVNVDRLSPMQQAELKSVFSLHVFDRYCIVLHIFKEHACTKVAKLQVALAEVPYLRSHLPTVQSNGHGRRGGGTRYIGGSGETFLELRKRLLAEREAKLKAALSKVQHQREMFRRQRGRRNLPTVAVVGYTNSGKTSLIKALTADRSMQPKDQLFATLDVTAHGGVLPNHMPVVYMDTVGFISNIPTQLIASFSATLEDAIQADVIVHVWDVSHPNAAEQHRCVMQTIKTLNVPEKVYENIIHVGNKIDLIPDYGNDRNDIDFWPTSATSGIGLEALLERIGEKILRATNHVTKTFRVSNGGPEARWLYKEGSVQDARPDECDCQFLIVQVLLSRSALLRFQHEFGDSERF